MVSERPLNADEIRQLIDEVADELAADGPQRRLIIVGGALLALHGLRDATRDVDSAARLDDELRAAVADVAARHDLAPKWLNDAAAAYLPTTFDPDGCEVLVDRIGGSRVSPIIGARERCVPRGPMAGSTSGSCGVVRRSVRRGSVVLPRSQARPTQRSATFLVAVRSKSERSSCVMSGAALRLFGRAAEIRTVTERLRTANANGSGGFLVVRGDPGVGKSCMLDVARLEAQRLGMATLGMAGVQSETHLAFAGLHQLVRPLLGRLDSLPSRQREALAGAFGMGDTTGSELFLIALASLELLADAATSTPLLVIAEDAQWLDRASADVLAFVARRVAHEPILVLAALRHGSPSVFESAELPQLRLDPLADDEAAALLDDQAPDLARPERSRVLVEAAGNPLALVELPRALQASAAARGAGLLAPLPLTERLEHAFAARATDLSDATRATLLVAAANDGDEIAVVLSAATSYLGTAVEVDALEAALAVQLIDVDGHTLAFRHPLMRSAIYGASSGAERRAAHAALADALIADPDRCLWHRVASSLGPDAALADELESAATRARSRGDTAVALAALDRAARLSDDPAVRGSRLLRAGELAFELAGPGLVAPFLKEAEPLALTSMEQARLFLLRELVEDEGLWVGDMRTPAFVEIVEQVRADGNPDLALNILLAVAQRCWWLDVAQTTRDLVVAAVERMPVAPDDARVIAALAFADPVQRGAAVADRIAGVALDGALDPAAIRLLGAAATAVGAFHLAPGLLATSVDGLRSEGRLGLLAQALVSQAWTGFFLGDWVIAALAAEEAGRLARETGQPRWAAAADLVEAALAALRGDYARAESLADDAGLLLLPMLAHPTLAFAQIARGLVELGRGEYGTAYGHFRRMFEVSDVAFHPFVRGWAVGEMAEAAARSGQADAARPVVDDLAVVAQVSRSALLQVSLGYAQAVLAGHDAEERFSEALSADLRVWPYHRARLFLAQGAWLRRQQRLGEARIALREARTVFDELGAIPWGERTRLELRATGERSQRRTPAAREQLTPQELQIARMAAEGLTNREIGQKLYLSHRTVGSHLYRIFPKLGITSRVQLGNRLRSSASM